LQARKNFPLGSWTKSAPVNMTPRHSPCLHVLDNQLRTHDTPKFIHIQPVGHVYLLAATGQRFRVEGDPVDLTAATFRAQGHLQVPLPHDTVTHHVEVTLKYRRREPLPPQGLASRNNCAVSSDSSCLDNSPSE